MPIIKGIEKILQENLIPFHTPGHKGREALPDFIKNPIENIDITEIPGSDNLHNPQGMILAAQKKAAQVFGAHKTYFLVNGSTVGIQAMILAICKPGDKLLVPRNCHRSVWSALILGDITPIYISPEIHPTTGISLSISPEEIEKALTKYPDSKGAVLTYPTYYGTCSNIEKISEILHNKNKLLLVDQAHGPHLFLHPRLPQAALQGGGDISVDSTHKILSSFTQSSMLHVGNDSIPLEMLEMYLSMLQSSSPSYPLMASLSWATQQAKEKGYEKWDEILRWNEKARKQINENTSMKAMGREVIGKHHVTDYDESKILVDVSPSGLTGIQVEEILRKKYKIQVELSDHHHVLAMTGMGTLQEDIQWLTQAMIDIDQRYGVRAQKSPTIPIKYVQGQMVLSPRAAVYAPAEEVPLEGALGRISKEFIIPYPPGIPMVLPGEKITPEVLEAITAIQKWGGTIIGPQDKQLQKIQVIK